MAGFLSGTGTLTYNGVIFPNQINARVSILPMLDSAGRMKKYSIHTLTVVAVFHNEMHVDITQPFGPSETLDDGMPQLIAKLTEPHATLVFDGKGLGYHNINTNYQDVAYGPFPKIEDIQFIGDNRAVQITWSVTTALVDCLNSNGVGQSPYGRLLELNYSMAWDIDESGLTFRTVNGILEIPSRRTGVSTRTIRETADKYRYLINIAIPDGYTRRQTWNLSPDKRTLTFAITDREIPSDNPYFPGTINPSLTYRVNNTQQGFRQWQASLSGSIEVAMNHPRWYSWVAFLLAANSKLSAISLGTLGNQDPAAIIMPTHFGFSEELFGRTTSFDMSWVFATTWETVLKASGLWAPIQGTTWAAYKTSMTDVGQNWSQRGTSQLSHSVSDDHLHDACEVARGLYIGQQVDRLRNSAQYQVFNQKCPPPKSSWLVFQNSVKDIRKTNTVAHYPLSTPEVYTTIEADPSSPDYQNPGSETTEPIVQRRSDSKYHVVMKGFSLRVAHKVPRFELTEFGKSPVRPLDPQRWTAREVGQYNCPVHSASWELHYICLRTPKDNSYKIEASKFQ